MDDELSPHPRAARPGPRDRALLEDANDAFRVDALKRALRDGLGVDDVAFDALYPPAYRALSSLHWTPTAVARRAAELLVRSPDCRVLDVGSGVGKFCIVGSLATGAHFTGIEQRPHLVDVARRAAHFCGATRATFVAGDIREVDWKSFDALYFYNPFAEHLFGESERIDDRVPFSEQRFDDDTCFAGLQLRTLAHGARVAMYHGAGVNVPHGFTLVTRERIGSDALNVWEKTADPPM